MSNDVVGILRGVLPAQVQVEFATTDGRDVEVAIAGTTLRIRRLDRGWPRQVRDALLIPPLPDVLIAPTMSPGARSTASAAGVGWVDQTGAAEIVVGAIVVSRSGAQVKQVPGPHRWTPAALAVVEALLTGTQATVSAVVQRTGFSDRTVVKALALLTERDLLDSAAARGRNSGRRVNDRDRLLDEYAEQAASYPRRFSVQAGVVWRDPIREAARLGESWNAAGTAWAATSALAAAVFAPAQTENSPWEMYVDASSPVELVGLARDVGLRIVPGGRLRLLPFPSTGTIALSAMTEIGLTCVSWPRAYADIRTVGVRGEDVAEHLRQEMLRE